MGKRQNVSIYPLLIMYLFLVLVSSCEKGNDNEANGKTTAVFNPDVTYGTMTDQDGNVYKTVIIGSQTWMAENLRTTKYNDGTAIPNVIDGDEWKYLTTGAYCNYNNTTSNDTIITYGRMYNWYALNTGKLAPTGWHVPTDDEWTTLIDYLGGSDVAGGKLKEAGTTHWNSPNTGAINESGFTALPGGQRNEACSFLDIGNLGIWWSATESNAHSAFFRPMTANGSYINRGPFSKAFGVSVRCLKN
jgi:uncharacterized protein (TIGR02145 family)